MLIAAVFAVIFGPAVVVFVVYAAAKWGPHREARMTINDVRPYDARKIAWRK